MFSIEFYKDFCQGLTRKLEGEIRSSDLARDAGLDAERGEAAERDMQRRRATGKLPFPEFEEEERDRLENILDYPPKGSPDYTARGGSS